MYAAERVFPDMDGHGPISSSSLDSVRQQANHNANRQLRIKI